MATHDARAALAALRDSNRDPHVINLGDDLVLTIPHTGLWPWAALKLMGAGRVFEAFEMIAQGDLDRLQGDHFAVAMDIIDEAEGVTSPGGSKASSGSSSSTGKPSRRRSPGTTTSS